MKKAKLFAIACALLMGAQGLAAQEPAEGVTYVSDPSQGVLLNRTRDNWFITAEGGVNVLFNDNASVRKFGDRIAPSAGLYAGKWFSPVFGGRFGVNWMTNKGVTPSALAEGALVGEYRPDGFYKAKYNEVGPMFDLMINLTNWWCGYRPGRVYNASFYVGGGAYFTFTKQDGDWKSAHDCLPALRAGLLNSFNVSKQVAINLDLRWNFMAGCPNQPSAGMNWSQDNNVASVLLGVTYKFKKREWDAPVVPVCPEPENCDALRARLAAADARIAELERALNDCLNRPVETVACDKAPIATVYYPIGVSRLSRENKRVVKAIAAVMNSESCSDKNYTLTGWADNYTGTDAINDRLRNARANNVKNALVANGVNADRLEVAVNNGNRMGEGDQFVALDRAVTIEEK